MHDEHYYDEDGHLIHPADPRHPKNRHFHDMMTALFGFGQHHPHEGNTVEHMAEHTGIAVDPRVVAHALGHLGINGDTIVAHINPREAELLKE